MSRSYPRKPKWPPSCKACRKNYKCEFQRADWWDNTPKKNVREAMKRSIREELRAIPCFGSP